MTLRTEIPYRDDSASLFEAVADAPWAVFLDSGRHHRGNRATTLLRQSLTSG